MKRPQEHYVKGRKGNYTDLIFFDKETGEIVAWMLHSGELKEWFSVSLEAIKRERPGLFSKMKDKITGEVIPSGDYTESDFETDQLRDENLLAERVS